jgi:hypothetical protein
LPIVAAEIGGLNRLRKQAALANTADAGCLCRTVRGDPVKALRRRSLRRHTCSQLTPGNPE